MIIYSNFYPQYNSMNLTMRILCLFPNRKRIIYRPPPSKNRQNLRLLLPLATSRIFGKLFPNLIRENLKQKENFCKPEWPEFLKLLWLKIFFLSFSEKLLKHAKKELKMFLKISKWKFCRFWWCSVMLVLVESRRESFYFCHFFRLRSGLGVGWPARDKVEMMYGSTGLHLTSLLNLSGLLCYAKATPHITRGSKKENYKAQVSPFSSSRLRKTSRFLLIWIYIKFSLRISIAGRQRKSLFCVCF